MPEKQGDASAETPANPRGKALWKVVRQKVVDPKVREGSRSIRISMIDRGMWIGIASESFGG